MLIRRFNAGARMVKVDANGRLQIPKDLIEKTNLVKEVVMTSVIDRMQIWDRSLKDIEDSKMSDKASQPTNAGGNSDLQYIFFNALLP